MVPIQLKTSERSDPGTYIQYIQFQPILTLFIGGIETSRYNLQEYFDHNSIKDSKEWILQSGDHEIKIIIQSAELKNDLSIIHIEGIAFLKNNMNEN